MQPLAAILAAVLLAAAAMAAATPLPTDINTTCSVVTADAYPDYDYCVNVLSSSDPSAARDGRGLAVIAANATSRNVTHTVGLIDDLLSSLPFCSRGYGLRMASNVSSALADLVAGRDLSESTYSLYRDAYDGGPLNCFMALTENLFFPRPRDPLAQENNDNKALVRFAMNIAMLIPKSSGSSDHRPAVGASPLDIINATCSSLSYPGYLGYDYCVSVLSSGPAARNTRDLAIVATNATAQNITSTVKLIEGLLSDVTECKLSYGDRMRKRVDSAFGDLVAGRDSAGAANKLADASRDAIDCDVVMSKRRGVAKNVLYQENAENYVSAHFASNVAMYSASLS